MKRLLILTFHTFLCNKKPEKKVYFVKRTGASVTCIWVDLCETTLLCFRIHPRNKLNYTTELSRYLIPPCSDRHHSWTVDLRLVGRSSSQTHRGLERPCRRLAHLRHHSMLLDDPWLGGQRQRQGGLPVPGHRHVLLLLLLLSCWHRWTLGHHKDSMLVPSRAFAFLLRNQQNLFDVI